MAAPIGKGPPRKPGASLTGKVMVDTVRGRIRVRKWPENHPLIQGSPRAQAASRFAAANRLAKVQHAAFQRTAIEATHGTPWYPRDPFLAFSFGRAVGFVLPDGSQIHSMANRNDVSKSLDVLSATPGKILKRGAHWWEPADAAPVTTGARIYRTSATGPLNLTAFTTVPMTSTRRNDGYTVNVGAPDSYIEVPPGVSQIIVTACLRLGNLALNNWVEAFASIDFNTEFGSYPIVVNVPNTGFPVFNIASGPIAVTPGQRVRLVTRVQSDTAVSIEPNATWLDVRTHR